MFYFCNSREHRGKRFPSRNAPAKKTMKSIDMKLYQSNATLGYSLWLYHRKWLVLFSWSSKWRTNKMPWLWIPPTGKTDKKGCTFIILWKWNSHAYDKAFFFRITHWKTLWLTWYWLFVWGISRNRMPISYCCTAIWLGYFTENVWCFFGVPKE